MLTPLGLRWIKSASIAKSALPDALEDRVEEKILSSEPMPIRKGGDIGKRIHGMKNLKYEYIKHLIPLCSKGLWLAEITTPASAPTLMVR